MAVGVPPPELLDTVPVQTFVGKVNLLLGFAPELVVTSWFRDPERNARAGGAPGSLHLIGEAADVDLPLAGDLELVWTGAVIAAFFDLSVLVELGRADHIHLQSRPLLSGERFSVTRR